MGLRLGQIIELMETVLTTPGNLSVYLERNPRILSSALPLILVAGLSTATGLYHLRSIYDRSFWVFLPFATIVFTTLAFSLSLLGGALLDVIVRYRNPEKQAQANRSIQVLVLSWLPYLFFLPASVPARFLSYQSMFMVLLGGLIQIWCLGILVQALRYQYELSLREAVFSFGLTLLVLLAFPVVIWVFMLLELSILLG